MTGEAVRDTKFAAWLDPNAWMEKMSGPKWHAVLREEEARVQKIVKSAAVQRRLGPFRAAYEAIHDTFQSIPYACGPAQVRWHNTFTKTWNYAGSTIEHDARDIVSKDSTVWVTKDIGKGAEKFQLQCWTSACTTTPKWTRNSVGPDLAILGSSLFYLGVRNKLIYYQLWSCNAETGDEPVCHYEEHNPMVNLYIEKQPDGRVVLIRENSQDSEAYELSANGSRKSTEKYKTPSGWILPLSRPYGIEFVWPRLGLFITKQQGRRILWQCKTNASPRKLLDLQAGDITIDPFSSHEGKLPCTVRVDQPSVAPTFYSLDAAEGLTLKTPVFPTGLKSERISARSYDGTDVYGIVTYSLQRKPTKLLMIGYGAYGMSTVVSCVSYRWSPLVSSGWAIGYTFLRGGGDHTEEWAKVGRRAGREKTIEDFEALVREAQRALNISANSTAIYGRSAGGLLMGGTLTKNPTGSLTAAIYTEVPYVDELRTTTNPELPLTTLEYNEFGAPSLRLEDFMSVGRLSPVDSATVTATPEVFVLARTAENDSQVFAYEPVKWVRCLRDSAGAKARASKLVIVEKGQGHFTPPDMTVRQWSLDTAILDAWISGDLR
jgi:hypothetical protein